MKKFFTIAVVALATVFGAKAEGNFYIGGNIGFMHDSNGGTVTAAGTKYGASINQFSIIPEVGYSFNDHWGIGTTIGFEHTAFCHWKLSNNMFNFDPYARFTYYRTSDNMVQLFIDGGAGIGLGWTKYDGGKSSTACTWNVGFRPGVAFNFSDKFAMVAKIGFLGYQGANNTALDAGYSRKGGISFDSNDLTLGFYFKF